MNPPPNPSLDNEGSHPSQSPNDYSPTSTAAATAAAALSEQSSPTLSNTPATNGRKRRATGVPGSRGVANLTPEQLAKKRANDREAQRAIRERTRNTIEGLERRIRELESQQPFQELQKVAQERDRALAECEELKRRLATVASVVGGSNPQQQQPNLHGTYEAFEEFIDPTLLTESNETELAALTAQQSPLPTQPAQQSPYAQPGAPTGAPYEQQHIHPDLRSPHSQPSPTIGQPVSVTSMPTYQIESTTLRKWSPSLEHPPASQYPPTNGVVYEQRLPPPSAPMQPQSNGERLGLNYVLDPKQHPAKSSPPIGHMPPYVSPSPVQERPIYLQLPQNSNPSCPLDSLLLDFLNQRRQQLSAGIPMRDVAGPEEPSLFALQDPSVVHSPSCHPVSALLIDILSKFPDIEKLPERVAVFYIMFLVLRWMICPCESCYFKLPEWARPVKEQLDTPHPAWHDHVPW